jgi:hypothetical protein
MFDTIILLTGAVEQPVFASVLRGHNRRLTVLPVSTPDDLAAVEITVLRRARLIAFTTNVIVPQMCSINSATAPTIFIRGHRNIRDGHRRILPSTIGRPNSAPHSGAGHHGISPTINLHGIQFRAVPPGAAEA